MFSITNRNFTSRSLLPALFTALLMQGCASTVMKQVSESDKDTAGIYNGQWQGTALSTASKQYGPDNWELNCNDMAGKNVGRLSVENGVAQINIFGGVQQAFVNDEGRFRFEVPMKEVAAASTGSDSSLSRGAMTFILYGSLEKQRGTMTFGIAEFSNNGCSSKVGLKKL